MIYNNIYLVYVDGIFVGITDEEDCISDIASNHVNGYSNPLLDDNYPDRVFYDKININRYYQNMYTICDKLSEDRIFCRTKEECEKGTKIINKNNLEKERLEAKLRAMNL